MIIVGPVTDVRNQKEQKEQNHLWVCHILDTQTLQYMFDATKGVENNNWGYTHILAIVDAFTGYLTLFLLKQVNTRVIADCLLKYVTLHSMPLEIVTDGGPEF